MTLEATHNRNFIAQLFCEKESCTLTENDTQERFGLIWFLHFSVSKETRKHAWNKCLEKSFGVANGNLLFDYINNK